MNYELAAIPPFLFDKKTSDMHLTVSKSTLKSKLQTLNRTLTPPDAFVILKWVVKWPCKVTKED